jgi:hypothetical protein
LRHADCRCASDLAELRERVRMARGLLEAELLRRFAGLHGPVRPSVKLLSAALDVLADDEAAA